jgi:hypothetical protein
MIDRVEQHGYDALTRFVGELEVLQIPQDAGLPVARVRVLRLHLEQVQGIVDRGRVAVSQTLFQRLQVGLERGVHRLVAEIAVVPRTQLNRRPGVVLDHERPVGTLLAEHDRQAPSEAVDVGFSGPPRRRRKVVVVRSRTRGLQSLGLFGRERHGARERLVVRHDVLIASGRPREFGLLPHEFRPMILRHGAQYRTPPVRRPVITIPPKNRRDESPEESL